MHCASLQSCTTACVHCASLQSCTAACVHLYSLVQLCIHLQYCTNARVHLYSHVQVPINVFTVLYNCFCAFLQSSQQCDHTSQFKKKITLYIACVRRKECSLCPEIWQRTSNSSAESVRDTTHEHQLTSCGERKKPWWPEYSVKATTFGTGACNPSWRNRSTLGLGPNGHN